MRFILVRAIAVLIASYITGVGVPLLLSFHTGVIAICAAIVIAIINHTIKPVAMLVTLPINAVTLGLFSFVINGAMILLAAAIVPGFAIPGLLMGIYFSLVLSITNFLLHIFE
jgi:putative membrane protein